VIPAAEKAIESGSARDLTRLPCDVVRQEVDARFEEVMGLKRAGGQNVDEARRYVSAMLGFQVYAHDVYKTLKASRDHGHSHRAEP
jgi:hypothetical protein